MKQQVVRWLSSNGWGFIDYKQDRERGVDIQAKHLREGRVYAIEAKGDPDPERTKQPQGVRHNSFLVGLGQVLTRMDARRRVSYGVAVPETYAPLVYKRVPWQVARRLDLRFLIVAHSGEVQEVTWEGLKAGKPPPAETDLRPETRKEKARESGWDIMKRQMPNSKTVDRRLVKARHSGRSPNYIRSLEALKRFWEKRGM